VAIVIHSQQPSLSVDSDHVYFAFPTGAFSYDCVSCGSQCCRGHGYAINGKRELQPQLETHSEVRFFLDPCDALATHYHVQNLAPGCFFLASDGRCSIQTQHGFAAKPGTCRFFPFNGLSRVGRYLVVVPHSQLCPLQVVSPGSSALSSHEELLQVLSASGVDDHVREVRPIALGDEALITLERDIVRLSEDLSSADDYAEFAAAQSEATARAIGSTRRNADMESVSALQRIRRTIDDVLGTGTTTADDPAIVRLLIAMTPSLRSHIVFRNPGDQVSLIDLHTLPTLLVALHSLTQLASRAGMGTVSYQTVMRVFTQSRSLLLMLSQLSSVLMWKPDKAVDLSFGGGPAFQAGYIQIARALLPHVQQRARESLGEILRPHLPGDAMQRVEFIKRVARRLDGRVARCERTRLLSRLIRSPYALIQQRFIGAVTPQVASSIAATAAGRRARLPRPT
jgi:hypothetical protein